MQSDTRPIGMLDSGVGGISILREVQRQLPGADVLYFADQGHVPYGPRDKRQIRRFTAGIVRFFLERRVKVVVIACNAASAAALYHVRAQFPDVDFVGMEPAVKPAAEKTRAQAIGVLTTSATFQGELFATVVDRFARDVKVVTQVCPEFVTLVEAGELDSPHTHEVAQDYLHPVLQAGVDQLVLGCTHFPFLTPVISAIAGDGVAIVDPSAAVARQASRVIGGSFDSSEVGQTCFFTSGDPARLCALAGRLLGSVIPRAQVRGVRWVDDDLVELAR